MLMQWGQFLDHDYAYLIESSTLSGEEIECNTCEAMGECVPIQVPPEMILSLDLEQYKMEIV